MKKLRLFGALAAAFAMLMPFSATADEHEEDGSRAISDVWVFALKRGMETEFAAAMQDHIVFRKEQGENRTWYAYRADVGHHPGLIMYRSEAMSYADHDAYLAQDMSALSDAFNENIDPLVDHFHHYIDEYDWENSHWPDDESTEGPLFVAVEREWKMGGAMKSEPARKTMSQIALNEGWAEKGYNWLWINTTGGAPRQSIVFPNANYAEVAPTGDDFGAWLAETVGSEEEAMQIMGDWLSGFSGSNVTIWRHDQSISTPSDED